MKTEMLYRCDNCGHESVWVSTKWIAFLVALGMHNYAGYEHEFHLCSRSCLSVFEKKDKKELTKIANKL
jgi:hypothetical protein